jgi:hypothetical protein
MLNVIIYPAFFNLEKIKRGIISFSQIFRIICIIEKHTQRFVPIGKLQETYKQFSAFLRRLY